MLGGDTTAAPDDAAAAGEEAFGRNFGLHASGAFHFFILVFFLCVGLSGVEHLIGACVPDVEDGRSCRCPRIGS